MKLFGKIALLVLIAWVLIKWQPIPAIGTPIQETDKVRMLHETKENTKITKVHQSKDLTHRHNSINPGERWMLINKKEDPFIDPETSYVEIIEIRSGWAKYKYDNGTTNTDKLKWFISDMAVFKKVED